VCLDLRKSGLVLLLLLDPAAEAVNAHELAVKIQRAQHLSTRAHVTVRGFPFLTQVLAGKYTEIDVSSDSPVTNRGVTLSSVSVRLQGVGLSRRATSGVPWILRGPAPQRPG